MNEQVVLITGGAGNVGRAVTRAFLQRGSRVAVPVYKTDQPEVVEALRAEFGDRLFLFALDLTTERGAAAAIRDVLDWSGRLDAVVHLIGGYSGGTRVAETPIEVWDRMIDLNLKSAWLVAHAALPAMLERGGGSFVFVSSRAARERRRGRAAYAVSKAALLTLVEAIAEEYRMEGIRANAVLPGTIDTEANRRRMPDAEHANWTHPEEIAEAILFLTSWEARTINGASIPVYGRS